MHLWHTKSCNATTPTTQFLLFLRLLLNTWSQYKSMYPVLLQPLPMSNTCMWTEAFWGLAIVETLRIYNPKSPRNTDQILIYILLTFSDSLRKKTKKETKLKQKMVTAISSLQFKYRIAALNILTLHPFLISLPACHSQESQSSSKGKSKG